MNLASTIRMMAEKKDNPPFDVSKADYAGASKELTQYAKTKGGMDKNDFLAFANRMSAIASKKSPRVTSKFARDLMDLDTSPREKIISVMRNNGIKVTVQGGGFKIEDYTIEDLEQLEELEEAKVRGKEVFDKTFANRTQADNFAKKNGGRVKQVGRVFYVFKEAVDPEDEGEYNDEGGMALTQINTIMDAVQELKNIIDEDDNLPEWVQSKITKATDYIDSVRDYLKNDSDIVQEAYKTPAEAKAYEDGKKAVAKKVSYDDNPNKKGTKEYTAWSKGHNDARAKMIGNRHTKGEVEEARDPSKSGGSGYDLYHKDFSSAMKHAYDYAKSKFGIEIDPKEIDDKVASGPRKPSAGKTNSYRLKGKDGKKGVQIQVANLDNKKYELNMYKEEVEMNEAREDTMFEEAMASEKMYIVKQNDGTQTVPMSKKDAEDYVKKMSYYNKKAGVNTKYKILPEEAMQEEQTNELLESVFEELEEATYQVDIKGAGRETVTAKNEKDAIAKASKKMKVHSFKSSDVTVKLVEEVKETMSLEDTLRAIWEGKSINKEDNTNDKSDDGEGLDKVQPKALKKKFKDRKDKDIDNDGDVDGSDEYLHNRRKTVSKAIKDEDADEAEDDAEKEVSDKEDEKKKVVGKTGKQTKVEVDPKLDEEVNRIMESFDLSRFVKYGNRAEQVMKMTAIKMAEKKYK